MRKLTTFIVAHNEEARLEWCIHHARAYSDEIVVAVQESTDRTLPIALKLADTVIEHPAMGSCEFSRGDGFRFVTSEWVLQMDADERLTEFGLSMIRSLLNNPQHVVYALRRLTTVNGQTIEDAHQFRLIRPGDWDGVHNRMHSSLHPRAGVPVIGVNGPPFIEHAKMASEQTIDDQRYRKLGYMTTEIRPEWLVVPWCRVHKVNGAITQ